MNCSALVPWEWTLVPHRVFHEVFSSSTVGVFHEVFSSSTMGAFHEVFSSSTVGVGVSPHRVFHEVFSSSTVEVGVSPHRVFYEVLLVVKIMSAVTSCQASKEQEYKPRIATFWIETGFQIIMGVVAGRGRRGRGGLTVAH